MVSSKPKSNLSVASNGNTTPAKSKGSKVVWNGSTESASVWFTFSSEKGTFFLPNVSSPVLKSSSPVPKPHTFLKRPPKWVESKQPTKTSTSPEVGMQNIAC
ncbi:unnamed protein product [Musa acuminata subsp. burmannicoides]